MRNVSVTYIEQLARREKSTSSDFTEAPSLMRDVLSEYPFIHLQTDVHIFTTFFFKRTKRLYVIVSPHHIYIYHFTNIQTKYYSM